MVIAGFIWFAAFVSFIVGFTLLFPNSPLEPMWQLNRPAHEAFQTFGRAAGAGFLLVAFVGAVSAIGFARGRRWAWWLAVVAIAVNMAGDVASLLVMRNVVRYGSGILIAGALLVLLLSRPARRFFQDDVGRADA